MCVCGVCVYVCVRVCVCVCIIAAHFYYTTNWGVIFKTYVPHKYLTNYWQYNLWAIGLCAMCVCCVCMCVCMCVCPVYVVCTNCSKCAAYICTYECTHYIREAYVRV